MTEFWNDAIFTPEEVAEMRATLDRVVEEGRLPLSRETLARSIMSAARKAKMRDENLSAALSERLRNLSAAARDGQPSRRTRGSGQLEDSGQPDDGA